MHDDLRGIRKLIGGEGDKPKSQLLTAPAEAIVMFDLAFRTMEENGLSLGGVLATTNPLSAPKGEFSLDFKFIYDPLHFVLSTRATRKCRFFHFDDLERSIYAYERDGGVLRLGRYAVDTPHEPYNPKAVGGLAGERNPEQAQKAATEFADNFKDYVGPFKLGRNGLRPNIKRLPFRPKRSLVEPEAAVEDDATIR